MSSYPLLENAPPHDTPEFLTYLRDKNPVVYEDEFFLIVKNCKYHTEKRAWYTAFAKSSVRYFSNDFMRLFGHMEWLKKASKNQTIPARFHVHMLEVE